MSDEITAASMITATMQKFNKNSTKISFAMFVMAVAMFILSATNIWIA